MRKKIEELLERFSIVEKELADPAALSDKNNYKKLTSEHSYLSQLKDAWDSLQKTQKDIDEHQEMLKSETDKELVLFIEQELDSLKKNLPLLEKKVETLLVPPDPNDHRNIIMELRAGTGGDEAAIFVGDCVRMYKLFSDKHKWNIELLSCSESEAGG